MRRHRITISFPRATEERLFGQIGVLAEELEKALKSDRGTSVENPDHFPDGKLYVTVVSDGRVRRALEVISACLKKELLDTRSVVNEAAEGDA